MDKEINFKTKIFLKKEVLRFIRGDFSSLIPRTISQTTEQTNPPIKGKEYSIVTRYKRNDIMTREEAIEYIKNNTPNFIREELSEFIKKEVDKVLKKKDSSSFEEGSQKASERWHTAIISANLGEIDYSKPFSVEMWYRDKFIKIEKPKTEGIFMVQDRGRQFFCSSWDALLDAALEHSDGGRWSINLPFREYTSPLHRDIKYPEEGRWNFIFAGKPDWEVYKYPLLNETGAFKERFSQQR